MDHNITTLKDSLQKLLALENPRISIGDISDMLGASAGILLVIILAAPMCLPFANIPGIAQAVSVAMLLIFYRYLRGESHIWLPAKVRDTSLSNEHLKKICHFLLKCIIRIEKIMHPRMLFLTSDHARKLLYIYCMAMVVVLALPLVIPFTNFLPGLAILLVNFGILQRDGGFIIAGIISGILSVLFIAYIIIFGVQLVM